ncbi:hypothetical protein QWZ10_09920 [Paracoccus cavernae]|uniref:Uncharacterized protein n=1 Tax=Paracoccus cavernae TaxID=1571207 RepID=A0ABT8D5L0_9RHOB|nr:hypothetical protein [Paracoccus cavernae]
MSDVGQGGEGGLSAAVFFEQAIEGRRPDPARADQPQSVEGRAGISVSCRPEAASRGDFLNIAPILLLLAPRMAEKS